jgi:signal-transduction protein with cAMP-binding, CBS, and nucleotidyltransferase domain
MLRKLPDDIQELGRTPLFRDLSKRELAAVQRFGTVIDRAAGTVLCQMCQSVGQVAVIMSGVVATTPAGGRRRQLGAGDFFGVLSDPRHPARPQHIETVTDVTLFVVGERDYSSLRVACPRLAARLAARDETEPATTWAQVDDWHPQAVAVNR